MKTSIVIPAYNEEKRIGKTLENYCLFLKKKKIDFDIIVVLNNCSDSTLEVVKEAQKKHSEVSFLNFKRGGKGFAIIEGFKNSLSKKNNLIGFVDADMSTSPAAFYDLISKIDGFDGVIASRYIPGAIVKPKQSFRRIAISRIGNLIIRGLFFFPYRDTQCGAKLFKQRVIKRVVDKIGLTEWAFDVNLLYLCKINKFKIKEIPTIWEDKEGSKIKSRTPLLFFLGIIRLRVIYSPIEPIARQFKFVAHWLYKILK